MENQFLKQDFYLALGFCEEERYGRIPVGGVGYDDERCERIKCTQGWYSGEGCSPVAMPGFPGCQLVRGKGHYSKCCKQLICD
ncbi:hypothetical protein CEXT_607191 [Caerostris extrusa]|uniref:Single domain-containing protein n=1 Tax=Caerostris extrusa TaxID=172846 RepID=A0AAV4VEX3_CAEEX|nr:hypothetical protein CEXT_607191 [Caerostris extrusa]